MAVLLGDVNERLSFVRILGVSQNPGIGVGLNGLEHVFREGASGYQCGN